MRYLLIVGKNRDSRIFVAGQINDDFHIAGIRQVVAERLKSVVMYSIVVVRFGGVEELCYLLLVV